MRILFLLLFYILSFGASDSSYELGKGVQVGSLPFYLGGYTSLEYENKGNENRYKLDDLSLLGYGSYDKFSYLVELEYQSFYTQTYAGNTSTVQRDTRLHSERVYVDYALNDNYTLRAGKYNSPIGFWNMLPINVLRQTTSDPMTSNIIFPRYVTGAGASYTSFDTGELKLDLMLQHNDDLDNPYNNYKIDQHYGFGATYEKNNYSLKFNGGYFHQIDNNLLQEALYYYLLSAKYETDRYQIMAEMGRQETKSTLTTPYAAYIQGVYRFTEKHIGVVRGETYDDKLNNKNDNIAIFGYTYRPLYPIALKAEYQFHSLHDENQFLFSFSVLF